MKQEKAEEMLKNTLVQKQKQNFIKKKKKATQPLLS